MPDFLGIDTSNYTTSAAVFRSEDGTVFQSRRLLPVRPGELGLRQSDAVFHHTKQLPEMIERLFSDNNLKKPASAAASSQPRNEAGSYMPCFLCGEGFVRSYAAIEKIPAVFTSHQVGHILAALYSVNRLELVKEKFIAFHVSGGTTDCLFCEPDDELVLKITRIGTSLDLKAGQAVDRTGLMLGLDFPCGPELEKLAEKCTKCFKVKATLKGTDCCLSGVENRCRKMLEDGGSAEDIAAFCLSIIAETIISMTEAAVSEYGRHPLVFAGGVMSDKIIRDKIISRFPDAAFADPQFSCDNAAGAAIFGYLKYNGEK